jgi:signal transduction histidine kinase
LAPERIGDKARAGGVTGQVTAYVQEALLWLPERASNSQFPSGAPEAAAAISGEHAHHGTANKRRYRILWADDNADMRDYVTRLLATSYDVHAAPDGEAALLSAFEQPPDLVLSDVMMPRLDGFGLLRALRAHERTKTVPVILLSARAGEEAAVEGLHAGADDYLVKPFSARELLARVRTHLELADLRRTWAQQLEQANRELEAFSYSVSHDLRAPLRAIDGFSKALLTQQGDRLDEQGKAHLNRVRAAAARMASLIDAMLDLARVSRSHVRRETVSIGEIAASVIDELQRRSPERRVKIEIEAGLSARADARLLRAMLENLLGNAWKFSAGREEAQIRVGRLDRAGAATFFVADNGAGFDMNYADKLFQPFSRLHAQRDFEGTGIGLATVQRIIARHGGVISAESKLGEGATFFFTLASET